MTNINSVKVSLANFMRLAACLIVKSGTFLGQAFKLFSRSRPRKVSTDAAIFKSFY